MKQGGGAPSGAAIGFFQVSELELGYPCPQLWGVSAGTDAAGFVRAMRELSLGPIQPQETAVSGYPALYIEFTGPTPVERCDDMTLWRTHGGGARGFFGDAELNRVWVVDVEGERLVVNTLHYPGTSAEDIAELEAIVESIRIRP